MELFNAVQLISDNKNLAGKGIKKGFIGILLSRSQANDEWLVMFLNPKNEGEYAVAMANINDLKLLGNLPSNIMKDIKTLLGKRNFLEKTVLGESKIKEYDLVELIVEDDKYAKAGVHKGMQGCVVSSNAINGKWEIIFSEKNTGKDIADIEVSEDDLIVIC